jgi:N-acetyl-gamma-glutamyl-phosphate reductase
MREHRVAVIGASGFGGALCARLVHRHPSLELTMLTARSEAGLRHDEVYGRYRVPLTMEEFDPDVVAERADAALVAYPHKAAALAVKALRERGLKVVDLSADFRLGQEAYEHWYQPHEAPELLAESVYGLPEVHRDEIRQSDLVANPGCNSTAALLALLPLQGRIEEAAVDIKAGVSGAGREGTDETHFVSVFDNVNAYKVEGHRHTAELDQELPGVHYSFVTHLLPIDQGILASCYARPSEPITAHEAHELAVERYRNEPFVDVVSRPPRTREVRDTNRATVQVTVVNERVLAFCAIDNLWKGASGAAIQNLNLMLGLPETEGLE